MAVPFQASFLSLPDLEAECDQDAKGNHLFFHKTKTDATNIPEDGDDAVRALDGDDESDDEADIHRFSTSISFSTQASGAGLRLSNKLFLSDTGLDDRSPWASPLGAGGGFGLDDEFDLPAQDVGEESKPMQVAPSVGSEQHGIGICKPCAWFWKSSGCQNGQECLHCHLCPKSEVKARKKAKAREHKEQVAKVTRPSQNEVAASSVAMDFRPPPGLPPPLGLALPAPALELDEVPAERSALTPEEQLEPEDEEAVLDRLPGKSVGSALHLAGLCKPCAWFWKQQGCENGENCLHCHLCPAGEVKRLKKQKKVTQKPVESKATAAAAVAVQLRQQQMMIQQQQQQLLQMQLQLQMQEQQMKIFADGQVQRFMPSAMLLAPQTFGA